jgi:hypothetical protein
LRYLRQIALLVIASGLLAAQSNPPEPVKAEIQHRLSLVATRAIAYFRSADSIEASLAERGLTLHADIAALRARLEGALDQADAAIGRDDLPAASEAVGLAQALLDRFAAKLGG